MNEQFNNVQYQNGVYPNVQYPNNNVKKPKKYIWLIIGFVILLLVSTLITFLLLRKPVVEDEDKEYTRTIMIYMVGSNLESDGGIGTADLNSIDYEEMDNENINVVLIAGGSEEWYNNYIDEDETSIYELTEDGYKKVKTQSIKNMGDSKVLSDYLNYVYENYESDKYELIFWNHGGAINGSEVDDLFNDHLTLEEMEQGFENSEFKGKNKLELIIFRTCLNGTIEVANVLSDYSEYLVASEEITLGSKYTSVLNFVNDIEVTDTAYDVGLKFIESYKKQIEKIKKFSSDKIYSTYSIVDLSNVDELIKSLNEFFSDINVSKNYNEISKVRSKLYQYAYVEAGDPTYDMVDLYNLVNGLKHLSVDKANKVLEDIETTVLYNWATNDKSRGMSIYFPYNGSKKSQTYFLNLYDDLEDFEDYNDFILSFNAIQTNSSRNYSFTYNDINVSTDTETSNSYDFTLELTDEQLSGYVDAEYLVFMDKGEGYYWPVYKGLEVDLNGNTLNANINGRALKILSEEIEYVVPLFETYSEDDYIKYTTSVILEDFSSDDISDWKFDGANLSLILDRNTNEISIGTAILRENDENKPSSVAVDLNDYEYIAFGSMSHKLLDENGNFSIDVYMSENNGIYEGVEVTIDELSNFQLSSFDDENDYYAVFRIYDVDNNVYYSNLIKMN